MNRLDGILMRGRNMVMIIRMVMIMRAASWETLSQEITRALTMIIILIILSILIIMIITLITRRSMRASSGEKLDQEELTGDHVLSLDKAFLIKW